MNPNLLLDPVLHETIRDRVREFVESARLPSPLATRTSAGWHRLLTLVRCLGRPQASPSRTSTARPPTSLAGAAESGNHVAVPPGRGFTATYSLRQPPTTRCWTSMNPVCRKAARIIAGGTHSSIVSQ